MPSRDELVRELTNQWLDKAEDDLNAAQALFDHGGDLWAIVAFHCQQSVEKFLKAMLTSLQVEFSKTHDIAVDPMQNPIHHAFITGLAHRRQD